MLRANIGLSRKVSRDYQSTGYSINLDAEVGSDQDDPNAIHSKIQKLYRLAQEALNQEIERDQSEQSIGRHDEEPARPDRRNGQHQNDDHRDDQRQNGDHQNGRNQNGQDDAATNKQVQYLLTLAKRHGLNKPALEDQIEQIVRRRATVYQLSKKEAGRVIDILAQDAPVGNRR